MNSSRVTVFEDLHHGVPELTGRHPVVDWMPAPPQPRRLWRQPGIISALADQWLASQRTKTRRSA